MKTLIKKYKSFEYFYCIVSVIIVSIIGFIRCDVQSIHLLSLMFNHVIIILFIIPGLLLVSNKEVNILFKNELIYRYGSKKNLFYVILEKMSFISIFLSFIYITISKVIFFASKTKSENYFFKLILSFFIMFMIIQLLNTLIFIVTKNQMISIIITILLINIISVVGLFLKMEILEYEYLFLIYKVKDALFYLIFMTLILLIFMLLLYFNITKIEAYGYEKIKK